MPNERHLIGLPRPEASADSVNHFHTNSDTDTGIKSQHHTLGKRRFQASPGDHIHDGNNSSTLSDYLPVTAIQAGAKAVSFTTQTSFTTTVTFDAEFDSTPIVVASIGSANAETTRWDCRPYSISTTGFSLIVYRGDGSDGSQTWSSIPVNWIAVAL